MIRPEYKEILRLKKMLEENNIPFETKKWFNVFTIAYPNRENRVCLAVENDESYGREDDKIEIMGLLTEEESIDDTVTGWLTAEDVFNRIQNHYKDINNKTKEMIKMANIVKEIKENKVHQGDLVFINHLEKPYKSGWWRLLRVEDTEKGKNDEKCVCYVLEIPVHKDYCKNTDDGSRIQDGLYVVNRKTVRFASNNQEYKEYTNSPYVKPRYEILACLKGVDSVSMPIKMRLNNSSLVNSDWVNDNRSVFTQEYEKMAKKYFRVNNKYEMLAEELI